MPYFVNIDWSQVRAAAKVATAAFRTEAAHELRRIGEDVATNARRDHPYTNRTHKLEDNTQLQEAPVDAMKVTVAARTRYASYVEEKPLYSYMAPAVRKALRGPNFRQAAEQIAIGVQTAVDKKTGT